MAAPLLSLSLSPSSPLPLLLLLLGLSSLPGFLQWRWAAPHAAAAAAKAKAAGGRGKNSAWCFSEQVPPAATPNNGNYRHHLRLKQASLRPGGVWGGGWVGWGGAGLIMRQPATIQSTAPPPTSSTPI